MTKLHKVGRIALRREGIWWNAYWALPDTMDGAVLIGSIPMAVAETNLEVKEAYMELMRKVVSTLIPGSIWPEGPHAAPEHERSGHG
jgi:hypothetical protein